MRPLLLAACIAIATTLTGCASENIGSAARVEAAARNVDAAELAHEVAALRARVNQTPRFAALALTSLITAVVTTALILTTIRFFPGLIK